MAYIESELISINPDDSLSICNRRGIVPYSWRSPISTRIGRALGLQNLSHLNGFMGSRLFGLEPTLRAHLSEKEVWQIANMPRVLMNVRHLQLPVCRRCHSRKPTRPRPRAADVSA